jgi:aspartyl-tRNA(Asn)/glutamyl-tRNA(Gln) amidotransferase subunit A
MMTQFTALANVLGLPATVFPVALGGHGRPLGCQALAWEDDTALGLARLLGRELGGPPDFQG